MTFATASQSSRTEALVARMASLVPASSIILNQVFNSACNFLVTMALVRLLGFADFGQFTVLYVMALSTTFMLMALVVLPAVSIAASEPEQSRTELLTTAGALLAVVVLTASLAIGAIQLLPLLFGIDLHLPLLPFAALLVGMALNDLARRLLLFTRRIAMTWLLDVTRFLTLAAALAWGAGHTGSDPVSFTLLQIAASYALALVGLAVVSRTALDALSFANFLEHARRLLAAGKWLSVSAFLQLVHENIFLLVGSAVVGTEAVGIVRTCQAVVGVINPVFFALEHIFPRRIGQLARARGWGQALRAYGRLAIGAGGGITLILAGLAIFAPVLLWITAGTEAAAYSWVLQGLCLVRMPYLIASLLTFPLRAIERTRPVATSITISSLVALVIAYPIIVQLGVAGIIAGSGIAYLVTATVLALQYVLIRRREFDR